MGKPQCSRCGIRVVPNGPAFAVAFVVFLCAFFVTKWALPEEFALVRTASFLAAALASLPVLLAIIYAGWTTRFLPPQQSKRWRVVMAVLPALWLLSVVARDLWR